MHIAAGQTSTIQFELPASELAFWDVTRDRWAVESGIYDILIGCSSADIRLEAALTVEAGPFPPRDLTHLTRAENCDEGCGIRFIDETRAGGTAVAAAGAGSWIAFKNVDFGRGVNELVLSISGATAQPVELEVRLESPGGPRAGSVSLPGTPGPYEWATHTAPVAGLMGIHDVFLVFGGALRLRTFHFQN
jgi:beta-glucosidase